MPHAEALGYLLHHRPELIFITGMGGKAPARLSPPHRANFGAQLLIKI
jgi:hypothetical protein